MLARLQFREQTGSARLIRFVPMNHHPTWLGHLSHDPDHEEALPGIENISEMKQRVELGPAELSRPVEIDPASKEDIAIQLTEGCILGVSPTV